MGADFCFVNRDSEQLLQSFGAYKLHWVATRGGRVTSELVTLLTVRADGLEEEHRRSAGRIAATDERLLGLAGSWSGDDVTLARSYDETTVESSELNLYDYAGEHYEDISMWALGLLVEVHGAARDRLVEKAHEGDRPHNRWLFRLGWLTQHAQTPHLEAAMEEVFGAEWPEAYWEAQDSSRATWRCTNGHPM